MEQLKAKRDLIITFIILYFYKVSLDLAYVYIISPTWSYAGYKYHPEVFKYIETFILLAVVYLPLPKNSKQISNIMLWLFFLLSYVPMLTLFAFKSEPRMFVYAVTGFWVFVIYLSKFPSISIRSIDRSSSYQYFVFWGSILIVVFLIYRYFGFSFSLDLSRVYDVRVAFLEARVPLSGYLFTWTAYILNPFFFAIFIDQRKWFLLLVVIGVQLLLFSCTGNKSFLFSLVLACFLIFIMRKREPFKVLIIGLTLLVILGGVSYYTVGDLWASSLFTRRTLMDQPQQSFFYYDYFSRNELTLLSQHRLFNRLSEYPYLLEPPNLIGQNYFNNPKSHANTGIIGDAYMNFGYSGFMLWGIILSLILKTMDSLANGKNKRIAVVAIALPSISLLNSGLLTTFFTHGLLFSFLVLYLYPKAQPAMYPHQPQFSDSIIKGSGVWRRSYRI